MNESTYESMNIWARRVFVLTVVAVSICRIVRQLLLVKDCPCDSPVTERKDKR